MTMMIEIPPPTWCAEEKGDWAVCPKCGVTIDLHGYRLSFQFGLRPELHECGPLLPDGRRKFRYGTWPEAGRVIV